MSSTAVTEGFVGDTLRSEFEARTIEWLLTTLTGDLGGEFCFVLRIRERPAVTLGRGAPRFTVLLRTDRAVRAVLRLSESAIGEAYLDGELDLEGDLVAALRLRSVLADFRPLSHLWTTYGGPLFFGQNRLDRKWISQHYDESPDFYLTFLDTRFRCYSHGYFAHDEEPLEDAIGRKLETALREVGARPGDRVLDIGAGWGAFTQFAGAQGVQVTSLTISEQSEQYVRALIEREKLPCRVVRQHFLEYQDAQPFDAIVNLGVTEHLPDYQASLAQYARLLKPGGRVFLDACASRAKFPFSSFVKEHVWPGNATPLVLHDYARAVSGSELDLVRVTDDRHNYYLTARRWAERLDAAREAVVARYGERQYRRFRLYLWGCAHGFATRDLGAYHWVLEKPGDAYRGEHFSRSWLRVPVRRLLGL